MMKYPNPIFQTLHECDDNSHLMNVQSNVVALIEYFYAGMSFSNLSFENHLNA